MFLDFSLLFTKTKPALSAYSIASFSVTYPLLFISSIEVSEKMRTYLSATEKELIDERDTVKEFL